MMVTIHTQPSTDKSIPSVYVARRVIKKMCIGSMRYQEDETGEALVGLAVKNNHRFPKPYLLDTIPPIEDVVRDWAVFQQGDDWQGSIFQWWHMNWELYRDLRRASYGRAVAAKWDVPLMHMGDWHKQPGMTKPSRGDFQTAKRILREEQRDYLITPIVTLDREVVEEPEANTVLVELETRPIAIRIDFWWLTRRDNDFAPMRPVIVPNENLPLLPPVAWWLEQPERFDDEMQQLEADGLQVMDVSVFETRGHPPLDTCVAIYRQGARNVLIAVTPVNYPERPPAWRVAPIMRPPDDQDFFEALLEASTEVPDDVLPFWTPNKRLLDGVRAIEERP